ALDSFEHPGLRDEPDRLGLELGLRQLERNELDALLRLDRLLLVADDLLGDDDPSEREVHSRAAARTGCLDDRRRGLFLRLGVVIALERLDDCGACVEVELANAVARAEVEIDRAL